MILQDMQAKTIGISNESFEILFNYNNGIQLEKWQHKGMEQYADCKADGRLFTLDVEGIRILSDRFQVSGAEGACDNIQELVCIDLTTHIEENNRIDFRVSILSNPDNSMNMLFQMKTDWHRSIPREVHIEIPFFTEFLMQGINRKYSFPANPWVKEDGTPLFKLHSDFTMPLGIFDDKLEKGFSMIFSAEFPWKENYNNKINRVSSLEQLEKLRFPVKPHNELGAIVEMRISAINNGWREYFDDWRSQIRKPYRLTEYGKPEMHWYKDTFLHHFTYIFGKEIFNYEERKLEVERLIKQGEEFGGYDAVLLWHQYPRLGVDKRTQWDFFEDFPGGMKGLKEIVEILHKSAIKVFLPFKPWDVSDDESMTGVGKELAKLVKEADVDGFFLDTMSSVPAVFREEIDRVKKGVVFCSEIQPHEQKNIEILTGSWDQYPSSELLEVDINLMRFVLPENFEHTIARWSTGRRKDLLIKRAVFNGTGIVIWQDVFGAWLPYSDEQKATIKKWKKLFVENKNIFSSSRPIPFHPVLVKGIYCNCFPADDGTAVIYTLYNDTACDVCTEIVVHSYPELCNARECWNGSEASITDHKGGKAVKLYIGAKDIAVIKISG